MAEHDFADYIGRSVEVADHAAEAPIRRLAATLDHDGAHWAPDVLPPLGHWLFHLPDAPASALGIDGHPAKGGFLPPIAQPRRMWAGGRLTFHADIGFETRIVKRTTISAVVDKGDKTFVTLRHEIIADGVLAVEEEQDLVYLPVAPPAPARPVETPVAETERSLIADETQLFRFSALTFNAHRIHYDLAYAQHVELYPALVVQGPLQAMLLMDHALRDGVVPRRFAFRARAPLYSGVAFTTAHAGQALWVKDDRGIVTMTAEM